MSSINIYRDFDEIRLERSEYNVSRPFSLYSNDYKAYFCEGEENFVAVFN
jgi:hypothetical protein